jgi:hypothetical protein
MPKKSHECSTEEKRLREAQTVAHNKCNHRMVLRLGPLGGGTPVMEHDEIQEGS